MHNVRTVAPPRDVQIRQQLLSAALIRRVSYFLGAVVSALPLVRQWHQYLYGQLKAECLVPHQPHRAERPLAELTQIQQIALRARILLQSRVNNNMPCSPGASDQQQLTTDTYLAVDDDLAEALLVRQQGVDGSKE